MHTQKCCVKTYLQIKWEKINKESAWTHQKDKDERTEFSISEDKFANQMNIFGE